MIESTEPKPDHNASEIESSEYIAEALNGLTQTEKTIIIDFYLNNKDIRNGHGAIRKKLNLNRNAYKVSLKSGLRKLRQYEVLEHLI
jgi:DNA-directed RNA polymerase sigma subunit (sigma70/sigma32)